MHLPPLKPIHADSALLQLKLEKFRQLSTNELITSLLPGQPGALKTRPDGAMLDGHHRIKVLRERGINVDRLPREIIARSGWEGNYMSGIYWIEGPWRGRLAIIARPRGGEWLPYDVRSWQRNQLDVVVSLLTQQEVTELSLAQEATIAAAEGIMFLTFPIPDRGLPTSLWAAHKFIEQLDVLLTDGHHVAIHCRHGIGRSALIAASLLVRSGIDYTTAFARIERTRGCPVPDTAEQKQWVEKFAALTPVPLFG